MKMKKSVFVIGIISMVLVIGFFLTGCSSSPRVTYDYMDNSVQLEEHIGLQIHTELSIQKYDDLKKDLYRKTHSLIEFFYDIVMIPAGEHSFEFLLNHLQSLGAIYNTYLTANVSLTYDFKPGRFYYIYFTINGKIVQVNVLDATDITIDDLNQMLGDDSMLNQLRIDKERIFRASEEFRKIIAERKGN
jgi:hypothetical protein